MIELFLFLVLLGCEAAQFSLQATTSEVTLEWSELEDLPSRSVHFAVAEAGTAFSWKLVLFFCFLLRKGYK